MTDKLLYKCLSKGTQKESSDPRASFNWMIARRAWFKVYSDRVACGDWQIPYADIRQATLFRFKHMFMKTTVIQLDTAGGSYQFGFNPWASPADHIDLGFQEKDVSFTYSTFSKIFRLLVVLCLAYWFWSHFLR